MFAKIPAPAAKHILNKVPTVAQVSLAVIPFSFKAKAITELLKVMFKEQMEDEELEFLKDKWVRIEVKDFNLRFEVSFDKQWRVREPLKADVTFSADSASLIKVAAAKEDPDTLFFQRQLQIEGDTELGLEVKNLLLSIELDEMPKLMKASVDKLAYTVEILEAKSRQIA
ncbi:SCP2 sterol-binding domain-containing protein [Shewanella sp. 202IG2-18]|uniref:ubiquinone anaerobic biosynthesis accessory factor UbiT n=1 Tax=Parashewanella hymeniacidonis TaxID=2807618 RepID=UPI001961E5C5|nr:SCP2 sterol-binding domain-containing protein [Parashewanella hymeniacidonis]MBM7071699.1 SCP2 sterol-binding domain-containing protein [Parashewanella hymeniacidonis]